MLILEDPRIKSATLEHIQQIFTRTYWWPSLEDGLYRPLTTLSYLFNYSILGAGDRPLTYHAINVLLHAANSLLLFAIGRRLFHHLWAASLAASLWAVHPLTTEAVTNLVGRADVLAAFGVLGALYGHLRWRAAPPGDRRWLIGMAIASMIAAWSKEHGVTAIAVIVLHDRVRRDRPLRQLVPAWTAVAVPALLFVIQRAVVLSGTLPSPVLFADNPIAASPFVTGWLTAVAVVGRYLWLMVWPASLSADYSFSQIELATGTPLEWTAWIVVAAFAALTVWLLARRQLAGVLLAAAFVVFLPVSNLLFAAGTIMAERLFYLPLAFLILASVPMAVMWAETARLQKRVVIAIALLVPVLMVRTIDRNQDWRSELTLWTSTVAAAPQSFKSHGSYAEALYQSDPSRVEFARVIAEKEASLRLLEKSPRPAEVTRPYREAAIYYLEYGDWLKARGSAAGEVTKAFERAAALAEKFLAMEGDRPGTEADRQQARLVLSTLYERLARGEQALEAARRAQAAAPFDPMSYRTTAAALLSARRADEAAVALMTGFMLTGNADLRGGLLELYRGGLDPAGCAVLADGTSLNPQCAPVRQHLCAAAKAASDVHRTAGRLDLAEQAIASVRDSCQ